MTRRSRRPRPARDDNHGFVREPRIADVLEPSDLASGEERRLLDLGAGVAAGVGGTVVPPTDPMPRWVIGRLVASGTDPAWMSDTRPVAVDEQTAREVATGEDVEWLGVVHLELARGSDEVG